MNRIFLLILTVVSVGIISCSSGTKNEGSSDTTTLSSPEGMGADTTSAEADSLRDSLNR